MRPLRDQLDESVHLYIREHDARIWIAAVEARYAAATLHPVGLAVASSGRRSPQAAAGLCR